MFGLFKKKDKLPAASVPEIGEDDDLFFRDFVLPEWKKADKDKSGRLSLKEVMSMMGKLNLTLKETVVRDMFEKVDTDKSKQLEFGEFRQFLENLCARQELRDVFEKYSASKTYLTVDEFLHFLKSEQHEANVDAARAESLLKKYAQSDKATKLFFLGFSNYISSLENAAYNVQHRTTVYQPMDRPLAHYYMASSHNTYLMAHQLKGESSLEAYANALRLGCRQVELDCWDGENGNPIVYHGHTMVTKLKFRDVIQCIKEVGFEVSPYPVLLSLEVHCSLPQQVKMAQIMKEIIGDMMPTPFIVDQTRPLPSPEKLKHKILIKGKMLPPPDAVVAEPSDDEEEEEEEVDAEADADADAGTSETKRSGKAPKEKAAAKGKEKEKAKDVKPPKPKKVATAKELSDLVHIKSTPFVSFQKTKEKNAPWETSSFSELKVKKMVETDLHGLIEFNTVQLARVYPKGTRFDSSNFNPVESWISGCQMVSLNYQTGDLPMRLNVSKFMDNGNSGYILKPADFCDLSQKCPVKETTLTVKVISGWRIPKVSGTGKGEVIDPYVKLRMFGLPTDCKKHETKVIDNNGFNPIWNESVAFALTRPDLAQLVLEVYDQDKLSKDDFIGYGSIPVQSLCAGYRAVHLHDQHSRPIQNASLLVHVSFQ